MDNLDYTILVTIPGYRIEQELGRGGMSTVYLAVQESLHRLLALKVMSPALTHDPAFKDRFMREGQIVAQLNHPNIITIYDIGFVANRYFIAMEYVPGPTLADRIKAGFSVADSCYVVKQVARALDYAHRQGFIHRDIKPSNILFREGGEAVLADFGIAKAVEGDAKLTKTGFIPGTPSYMSPEQIRGLELDRRSDLYSLGVLFFEMLTRKLPYRGDTSMSTALKHLTDPIPKLPSQLEFLQPVVEGLLAKDPEDRFATEQALREALDRAIATSRHPGIMEETTLGYREEPSPLPAANPKKSTRDSLERSKAKTRPRLRLPRKSWRWAAGAGVLVLAAGGTVLMLSDQALDPRTQRAVDRLLFMAERQLAQGQLVTPKEYNAYDTYQEILAIAPKYEPALEGLDRIASHFEQLAERERKAGKRDKALMLVGQGLEVMPKHQGLLALQATISHEIAEAERQRQAAELLAKADRQFGAWRLTKPKGDNALETYRAVLALAPDNNQAIQGLKRIADRLLGLARSRQAEGSLDDSLAYVREGLDAEPKQKELLALKSILTQQLAAKQQQERIAKWHDAAEQQLTKGQLASPPGQNAFETYQRILAAEPGNEKARAGLQAVAARMLELAGNASQQRQFDESLAQLELGLRIFPGHQQMQGLREEVLRKQEIKMFLAKAKQQIADSKHIEPKGDNALESYQRVLALEPQNAAALEGLRVIADRQLRLTRRAEADDRLDDALAAAQEGLRAAPDHTELTRLKDELEQAINQRRAKERLVATLLATAKQHLEAGRYTAPASNNAYDSYQHVLRLAPEHEEALRGIREMVRALEEQALAKQRAGDLQASLGFIAQGLKVNDRDQRLLALREQVLKEQAEQQEQARIAVLLDRADDQRSSGQLLEPKGDNAHESYQAVFALDPENPRARAGIKGLVDHFLELAQTRQAQGQLEDSLALIQQGKQVAPREPRLLALAEAIQSALELRREKEQQIQFHLEKAARQLAALRLSAPKGDNALESYRKVLALDPQNQEAQSGIGRVVERYVQLAEHERTQGALDASARLVEAGLSVRPEHPELLRLKQTIETERVEGEMTTLLAKAEKQFADDKLTAPEGDNALASFNQALALAPNNPQASEGIQRIAKRFGELARTRQSQGKFEEGLVLIEQGLAIAPDEPSLLSLQEALQKTLGDERRTAEQITALLESANAQLTQGRLVEPPGDNAHAAFKQVLTLDPDNRQAIKGIEQVRDQLFSLAEQKAKAEDPEKSLRFIAQGLAIAPDDRRLLALRKEVRGALDEKKRLTETIERFLTYAEEQEVKLRLTAPEGDNAHESYRNVLGLDPTNTRALSGIKRITDRLRKLAQEKLSENSPVEALALIEDGLSVSPEDAVLRNLAQQTSKMVWGKQRVTELLSKGEAQLARAQFTAPPGDSAVESFRAALAIDPQNSQAQTGLKRIADHFRERAKEERRRGNYVTSLVFTGKGRGVLPEDRVLRQLQAAVQAELAARHDHKRSIKRLLAAAEAQLARHQWAEPRGENALQSYQAVLALEPNSAEALAGLNRIADHYVESAEQEQAKGEFEQSLASIEQGLRAVPDDARLQTLRAEASEQLAEVKRREELIAYWLAKAKEQLDNVRLLDPPGDNAYQSYQEVLRLEPKNQRALEGIEHLIDQHVTLAEATQQAGELTGSLMIIEKGLSIAPDHPELLALREDVQRQRDQQTRQQQLAGLLAQAEAKMQASAFSDSLALIQQGLSIAPEHAPLLRLKADVERRLRDEQRSKQIARLVARAEQQLADGRLTAPKDDNAFASFEAVLALDPGHQRAIEGVQRIARRYAVLAEEKRAQGEHTEAQRLIEQGLAVVPGDRALLALRKALSQEPDKPRDQDQLEALLTKGEQQLTEYKLTRPLGDNALESFKQVLAMDAQNERAQAGLTQIAERYARLAAARSKAGKVDDAQAMLARGLEVDPTHAGLLALRESFQQAAAEQQQRHEELAGLLAAAERKMAAEKWFEPAGDSAYDLLQRALILDGQNQRVREGLGQIAAHCEQLARRRSEAGDLSGALAMVERGLEVDRTHSGLRALGDAIRQAVEKPLRPHDQLESLLAKAEEQMAAEQWTKPPGENAYESFKAVQAIDSGNERAKQGLQKIEKRYEQLARNQQRAGKLKEGLKLVREGLRLFPGSPPLIAVRAALNRALAEAKAADEKRSFRPSGTF